MERARGGLEDHEVLAEGVEGAVVKRVQREGLPVVARGLGEVLELRVDVPDPVVQHRVPRRDLL